MRRQYFNLTELFVIIGVIFLLLLAISTFMPPHGAREKALRISCASNLKQLGTTMFMYAGDYNDTFPDECTSNSVTTMINSKVKGLNLLIEYKYLSDTTIYNCPSTTDDVAKTGNTITTLKTARTCSYIYAPGMMTGASDIYGNSDSALVADMTGVIAQRTTAKTNDISSKITQFLSGKTNYGNHDQYGNILFQGMHVLNFNGSNQEDWFLLNYGSTYDPATQKGSKDSSWSLTGQYLY